MANVPPMVMEKKPAAGNISIILCGCGPPHDAQGGRNVLRKTAKAVASGKIMHRLPVK
jgi:hypothetical protein